VSHGTILRKSRVLAGPSTLTSKLIDSRTIHSIPIIPAHPPSSLQANEPDLRLGSGNTVWRRPLGNDVGYVDDDRGGLIGGMGGSLRLLRGTW
jgi:hypothetical protein